ncbi:hypothetical protein AN3525.2 [Aspergillus nidulans FGSC A4]|uniref:CHAT domain-containing protein n=1 Tax=Emericella nidulans (strain FGSC A4 / ATCC 38163 / CBS 112.46 / NRRL 194 / M139) TaxID=227321 RepID=Q5B7F5_EMENI|nr:hypothetical protein [Aspergillus nidulans FGSC A4]EAA59086.1 hypothetical protein AN3525.2 [Aspergillus nidulans FGSC A4]CBF75970.1 TPA: conserved hypothetical protein [Aspergillus nidulans FGSC A4]|eukprot:XP_661129.1 hypothetical protein AN3525.2 [Aspergillus nidulans FGSC A4]
MFYQIFTGLSMELDNLFDQALQGLLDYEANKDRENCLDKSIHIARQVTKYERRGQLDDLDTSIAYMPLRIDETVKRDVPRILDYINMSVLKGDRYDVSGLTDHAMAGVEFATEAERLACGRGVANEAEAAAAMGAALLKLCQGGIRMEKYDPLDTAIAKIESAIERMPDVNKDVIQWQHNLATLLELRFERHPRMMVLDQAIQLSESVVEAGAANRKQKAIRENSLGNLFGRKFEWTGASEYLDNSIERLREKRLEDLEEAIENSRKACELGKSSPDEAISLNKLSTNLHKLYGHTKEKDCLEDAVKYGLQVWELIGQDPNSPFHQACAHNVALVLTRRFRLLGAQKVFNDALKQTNKDAYEFPQGRVHIRLRAAVKALGILRLREDWEQARAIGSGALKLLPDLCERSLTLDDQQYAILQATGLAADVCSLYLQCGLVTEALQKLEFGRGLILRYMIDRQGDVPGLERVYPDLAAGYKTLQRQLVRMRLEAGEKLKAVVNEIRHKKGFEAFLLEPKAEELTDSVADGVAVVVNVTSIRADAIIVSSNQIRALAYSRSLSLNRSQFQKDTEKESVLIVAMPTTPGHQPLSGVIEESNIVRAICRETHVCELLNHPTADQVCRKLATSDIVHFDCHGSANESDPSQSYLLPQKDGVLDKLTVSRISNEVSQQPAWVAYLSACSTAQVRATKLADESLHIASAFQMSGFPHVIGSLWPTDDAVCVKVAEFFYTYLFDNSEVFAQGSGPL